MKYIAAGILLGAVIGSSGIGAGWLLKERSLELPVTDRYLKTMAEGAEEDNSAGTPTIERYHDKERKVTCYIARHEQGPSIACLKD